MTKRLTARRLAARLVAQYERLTGKRRGALSYTARQMGVSHTWVAHLLATSEPGRGRERPGKLSYRGRKHRVSDDTEGKKDIVAGITRPRPGRVGR